MKYCFKCDTEKPKKCFGTNKTKSDGLQSLCKECRRQYQREWYENNRNKAIARNKNSRQKRVEYNYHKLLDFFGKNPCVDCGEKDPLVLEFDHIEPSTKKHNISDMINSYKWESIMKEVIKCEVRCANCHRRKTQLDSGTGLSNYI